MRHREIGSSKMSRISCSPFCEARHPPRASGFRAESMGKSGSSDVSSTVAICRRSSQPCSESLENCAKLGSTILFLMPHFPIPLRVADLEEEPARTWPDLGGPGEARQPAEDAVRTHHDVH